MTTNNNALIIAGVPGTGKTTLMKNIINEHLGTISAFQDELICKLLPSHYNPDYNLHILGKYDDSESVFQGTDRYSMACQPEFPEFLNRIDGANLFFEGDRLFNGKTIDSLFAAGYDISIIVLTADSVLEERYKQRGSDQNPQFLKSRKTKIDNLVTRFDLMGCIEFFPHIDESDTQNLTEYCYNKLNQHE